MRIQGKKKKAKGKKSEILMKAKYCYKDV